MKREQLRKGGLYVVRLKDERSVDLLRELKQYEVWMLNFKSYTVVALKALAILVSVCIPPLLLITIPLFRRSK